MYEQLDGLVASPRPVHLHVKVTTDDNGDKYPWHVYDFGTGKAINIGKPALKGQLTKVHLHIKQFQQQQNYKVDFHVRSGDRNWIIRSGTDTNFTRGLVLQLMSIENLSPNMELTILAEPGDQSVRGSVWLMGVEQRVDWDPDVKLFPMLQELQKRLGQEPQTVESIKADFQKQQESNR